MLTLGEASRVSGRAKASILAAIRDGRLSASRDETGRWQIDPAELTRVYPVRTPQPNDTEHAANADVVRLEERVQGLERLLRQVEGERDSLKELTTRLTALLTDQRPAPEQAPKRRRWWPFRRAEQGV